jgi:hypothetical protein
MKLDSFKEWELTESYTRPRHIPYSDPLTIYYVFIEDCKTITKFPFRNFPDYTYIPEKEKSRPGFRYIATENKEGKKLPHDQNFIATVPEDQLIKLAEEGGIKWEEIVEFLSPENKEKHKVVSGLQGMGF